MNNITTESILNLYKVTSITIQLHANSKILKRH